MPLRNLVAHPSEIDPYPSERPQLRPYVSTRFAGVPKLCYINEAGKPVALVLCEHDLAHLMLSIATAQEALARRRIRSTADAAYEAWQTACAATA